MKCKIVTFTETYAIYIGPPLDERLYSLYVRTKMKYASDTLTQGPMTRTKYFGKCTPMWDQLAMLEHTLYESRPDD